jgi:D-alanine transaminase
VGIDAVEARLTPDDLRSADEAFITGTTREITPVVAVDELAIGSGRPGAITQKLMESFKQKVGR